MPAKDASSRIKAALRQRHAARDPLERLTASRILRESAEELEAAAIREARDVGITWQQIGECYGLTKQGAHQRFKAVLPRRSAHRTTDRPR